MLLQQLNSSRNTASSDGPRAHAEACRCEDTRTGSWRLRRGCWQPSPCAREAPAPNADGAKRTQKRKKNRQIISGNFAFNQINRVSLIQTFKPTFVSSVHLTLKPFPGAPAAQRWGGDHGKQHHTHHTKRAPWAAEVPVAASPA